MLQNRETRTTIVRAALKCVEVGDWETTSLQAVRDRAGVSNGSLFHHFGTRQELNAAVVAAALSDHQQALLAELTGIAETTVVKVVRRHLQWVQDNVAVAQVLLYAPADVLRAALAAAALEANRAFFRAIETWLNQHGWQSRPELPTVLALWIGPAQEHSRQWLAGARDRPLVDAAEDLGRGAWAALAPALQDAAAAAADESPTTGEAR